MFFAPGCDQPAGAAEGMCTAKQVWHLLPLEPISHLSASALIGVGVDVLPQVYGGAMPSSKLGLGGREKTGWDTAQDTHRWQARA